LQIGAIRENYVAAMNPRALPAFIRGLTGEEDMVRKVMTIVMIGGGLLVAACNTVRGAGQDLQSAANCTENAIKEGYC
jgi:predicted small secreted protein